MNHQRVYALDIETIPNPDMVDMLPDPEVALGNTKDQAKIDAKIAKAREKQIADMALDPLYGKVCCIGVYGDVTITITSNNETELIDWFFGELLGYTQNSADTIVTWNGMNFDIPFLYKRGLILGNSTQKKPLSYWMKRYSVNPHCDLMQVWANWSYKYTKLDNVSKILFSNSKLDIDYKKFPEMMKTEKGQKLISEYCLHDCVLTYNIYERCQGYLFF